MAPNLLPPALGTLDVLFEIFAEFIARDFRPVVAEALANEVPQQVRPLQDETFRWHGHMPIDNEVVGPQVLGHLGPVEIPLIGRTNANTRAPRFPQAGVLPLLGRLLSTTRVRDLQ